MSFSRSLVRAAGTKEMRAQLGLLRLAFTIYQPQFSVCFVLAAWFHFGRFVGFASKVVVAPKVGFREFSDLQPSVTTKQSKAMSVRDVVESFIVSLLKSVRVEMRDMGWQASSP